MDDAHVADPGDPPSGKTRRPRYGTIVLVLAGLVLASALIVSILNSGMRDGGSPGVRDCRRNLANVTMGLHVYGQNHGHYPAAVVREPNRPARSWRVELLDYYDQPELAKIYDRNAKWSSARNRPVRDTVLQLFICPRSAWESPPGPRTDYVLVTGPGTAFPPNRTTTVADITDGLNQTIVLIEIPKSQIYWAEPRDFSRAEAVRLFDRLKANPDEAPHAGGENAGFIVGRARLLPLRAITSAQFDDS